MAGEAAVPVLIDVDTGIDDAHALLLAVRHPALRVLAVTTVAGNLDVRTPLAPAAAASCSLPSLRRRPVLTRVRGPDRHGDGRHAQGAGRRRRPR